MKIASSDTVKCHLKNPSCTMSFNEGNNRHLKKTWLSVPPLTAKYITVGITHLVPFGLPMKVCRLSNYYLILFILSLFCSKFKSTVCQACLPILIVKSVGITGHDVLFKLFWFFFLIFMRYNWMPPIIIHFLCFVNSEC